MPNPDHRAIAAALSRPGWLVIPAPYHGGLSAFAACTPEPLIIDATDPHTLRNQMNAAELAAREASRSTREPSPSTPFLAKTYGSSFGQYCDAQSAIAISDGSNS